MPTISMFYGIIIKMYYFDNTEHNFPHIHVEYSEFSAVFKIPDAELITGELPNNKLKLLVAWVELHKDELMANWKLASEGNKIYKIEPLR